MYNYNTVLPTIQLKAYGRHIQSLVGQIVQNTDAASKNDQAQAIISLMKRVKKENKAKTEHDFQFWADLFTMANYDLDVETPYPIAKRKVTTLPRHNMRYQPQKAYQKWCGRYFTELALQVKKAMGTDETQNEQLICGLIKCAQLTHKKASGPTLLHHIELALGQKIDLTPSIETALNRKNNEKK